MESSQLVSIICFGISFGCLELTEFAGYDVPADLVDTWNVMLTTNDMLNANTGKFDPRHMWGASNQVRIAENHLHGLC